MTLHRITGIPPEWLGIALERFESQFSYPLGDAGSFRISHGRQYLPFFQAMGKALLLAVEAAGEVVGTLVVVERVLRYGERTLEEHRAHYLCDFKVSPAARGGRVAAKLLAAAKGVIMASQVHSCYGIVMDGTGRLPVDYTGRIGIPAFEKLGEIQVLRITRSSLRISDPKPCQFSRPGTGGLTCVVTGGDSALRSIMPAYQIRLAGGAGVGLVEDTRRGKQLWMQTAGELCSAHLSGFSYSSADAGAAVIREALTHAGEASLAALFVAVPARVGADLRENLKDLSVQVSSATVFGYGIASGFDWWVDTSEI